MRLRRGKKTHCCTANNWALQREDMLRGAGIRHGARGLGMTCRLHGLPRAVVGCLHFCIARAWPWQCCMVKIVASTRMSSAHRSMCWQLAVQERYALSVPSQQQGGGGFPRVTRIPGRAFSPLRISLTSLGKIFDHGPHQCWRAGSLARPRGQGKWQRGTKVGLL